MQIARITLYILAILSATVTWCLAAAFLALTESHLNQFYRGDIALLVFGILAMLFLPFLAWLGSGHRRENLTGPTIAESITVFIFWAIFLAASAKFSASFHGINGWSNRCRIGFQLCSVGRALMAFGWITFGLLTALFFVVVAHGIFHEDERKREEEQRRANINVVPNENAPYSTNAQGPVGQQQPQQQQGGGGMTQVTTAPV
ncbi:uncharacterized protein JCM6883_003601 [Sporobolomyces salmoneus]|uniref:uncharacterized protein n=1 Tax=Sporobolomyces salmoneus TaxID=183962 RepID=UPI00317F2B81